MICLKKVLFVKAIVYILCLFFIAPALAKKTNVVNSAGRVWMDRDLGARRVALSASDPKAYGGYFQWGRGNDGHAYPSSTITTTLSSSDSPGHDSFIAVTGDPFDWRQPSSTNLWQGVNGTNNPCPTGFRLPTAAEWQTEINSWSSENTRGAFTSPLKLVTAGNRQSNGDISASVGLAGLYWSSTTTSAGTTGIFIDGTHVSIGYFYRGEGNSVRCIQD